MRILPPPTPSAEPGTRFIRSLTLFVLMLTLLFAAMAYSSWNGGVPSPVSAFGPRVQTVVTAVAVHKSLTNGAQRHHPLVTVEWPVNSGISRALDGLEPSFYTAREANAEKIIARYKVGDTIRVRVIEGRPIADRNDLFRVGHAVFLSFFSLLAGLFTYVFFHAGRASRKARNL